MSYMHPIPEHTDSMAHLRPQVRVDPMYNGRWNLPSVRDILHAPHHETDGPAGSSAVLLHVSLCSKCLSNDRKVQLRPDRSCPNCTTEPVTAHQPLRQFPDTSSIAMHNLSDASGSRRSSAVYYPQSLNGHPPSHASIQTPLASPLTPTAPSPAFPHVQRPVLPGLLSRPAPQPQSQPQAPARSPSATQPLSAAKKASNDRHKLSEKHRRDGQGSYVRAGYEMRAGLDPGVLSKCQICIVESSSRRGSSAFCSGTGSFSDDGMIRSMSPSNGASANSAVGKLKIPKNNMLEESLMWEFSWVLHMVPHEVAVHLERIRLLAAQMEADKAFGLQTDWMRRKKWNADVRGEVLMLVVAKMEEECMRHGVDAWTHGASPSEAADTQRKRQRNSVDDAEDDMARFMKRRDVPTPPSSRGSREGSANIDDRQSY